MQPIGESIAPRKARTARTLSLIGLGVVAGVGGLWLVRLTVAQAAAQAFLRQNGIDGQVRVRALGPTRVVLDDIRLGPASAPDLRMERLAIHLRWGGIVPRLERIEAAKPKLFARWEDDRLSLGSLDRLLGPPAQNPKPFVMPAIALAISEGEVRVQSPLGLAMAKVSSKGILGRDFLAEGQWQLLSGGEMLSGPFSMRADASGVAATLHAAAPRFAAAGIEATGLRVEAAMRGDLSLTAISGQAGLFADALQAKAMAWQKPALRLEGGLNGNAPSPIRWRMRAGLSGARWRASGLAGDGLDARLALDGTQASAGGRLDAAIQSMTGPGFSAAKASLSGPIAAQSLTPLKAQIEPALRIGPISADAATRARLNASLSALAEGPLQDFAGEAIKGINGALARAQFRADPRIILDQQGWAVILREPAGLFADNGAFVRALPGPEGITGTLDGKMRAKGALQLGGPNLPSLEITQGNIARGAAGMLQIGARAQGKWQAKSSRLGLDLPAFSAQLAADGHGRARSTGHIEADLEGSDLALAGLRLPLDGALSWAKDGVRFALADPACTSLAARSVGGGGVRFERPQIRLCAPDGNLFAVRDGQAIGGFRLGPIAWRGALEGKPISLQADTIIGQWRGDPAAPVLRISLARADLRQAGAMLAALGRNWADVRFGPQFGAIGRFENGAFAQSEAPTQLSGLSFDWNLSPKGELQVRGGGGLLRAVGGEIPLHQPIRLKGLELSQTGSRIMGRGRVMLDTPEAELGQFSLRHDLESGLGEGDWQTNPLTFSSALQPYQISETLRGVIELARGAIAGSAHAQWDANDPAKGLGKISAQVDLQKLSFSTLALGPIDGVSGQIAFDDLLASTTPEGQRVTVDKINPGLPVENGTFIFQLEPNSMLRLQSATWPYAKGVLSIDPTRVRLGGDVTTFNLRLSGADLPSLLDQLSLSESVRATGTVEGEFPLVFTPAGGRIENGKLAAVGAGLIAMQNPALDQTVAQGADAGKGAGIGFLQALQGFSYEELALRNVTGAIDGEISADIVFAGENVAPISLPIPGGKNLVGLPYRFRVSVRAPLLQLSRSAQSALDYNSSIAQALELEKQSAPKADGPTIPENAKTPENAKIPEAPR